MKAHRLLLILLFVVFTYADVMYEMKTTTEGMMGMGGETMMRVFVKGDFSRTETTLDSPVTGETTDITIVRLDKGTIWTIDTEKKEYTETTFEEINKIKQEVKGEEEVEVKMPEIKIEKTGEVKKLLDKDCEKVVLSMDATSEEGTLNFTQTMWVTKDVPGYKEINNFNKKLSEVGVRSSPSTMMGGSKKSYEEFQQKTSEIEGFPLEIDLDMTMSAEGMSFAIKMHSIITNFDTNPIDKKVFEIPKGYTLKK